MAKLRGKAPTDEPKRLKFLLSGDAGTGKTTAAIQMPKPYIIDCERGCVHYGDLITKSGGAVFEPGDIHELLAEVRALMTEKHDFLTVVIDPITTIYHALGDEGEKKVGSEFSKNYKQYADKFIRRLLDLLTMIDMNVVVTAHEKNEWGKDEDGKPTIVGKTFDGYAKLHYMFDLWFKLTRGTVATQRIATVAKTRLTEFPDGDSFDWGYKALCDHYGKERLEKGVQTVTFASGEQVERFRFLFSQLDEAEVRALKLSKVDIDNLADMTAERLAKGIELIEKHRAKTAAA